MQTNLLRRYFVFSLVSLFTIGVLTACGGGGSSSSGGSRIAAGKADLQGNVSSDVAYFRVEPADGRSLLSRVFNVAIDSAYASGVAGVTVELLKDGVVVDSQMTNQNGDFSFSSLAPGNYTLRLALGAQSLGESPVIQLDPNTRTRLNLDMNGGLLAVEVEAEEGGISGEVEDGKSNDDDSSDDVSDDTSSDDGKSDDDSMDDVSEDDQSKDDGQSDDDCSDDESQSPNCS